MRTGEAFTRLRPGASTGVDRYNVPIPGADLEAAFRGLLARVSSVELAEVGRNSVTTAFDIYIRGAADVVAGDRVRLRGDVYDVVGDPALWLSQANNKPVGLVIRAVREAG